MSNRYSLSHLIPVIIALCIFSPAGELLGNIIMVPAGQPSVQAGIDAAGDGDTVLVSPGRYVENIDLSGKAIHLLALDPAEDATIIDGSSPSHPDTASTVIVVRGEGRNTVIEGFTIVGGGGTISPIIYEEKDFGGGIFCQFSSPTIRNNVVKLNSAFIGAGILANVSSARIEDNIVRNNSAERAAGGIGVASMGGDLDSVAVVTRNLIYANRGGDHAGGIEIGHGGEATFTHNIIAHNRASSIGGVFLLGIDERTVCANNIIVYNTSVRPTGTGIRVGTYGGSPLVSSNIVAYNGSGGGIVVMESPDEVHLTHNVVWGNTPADFLGTDPGVGDTTWGVNGNGVPCDSFFNIVRDPLLSSSLPWEMNLRYGSPAIDAGSPDLPLDPDGTIADVGARYFSQKDSVRVVLEPLEQEVEQGDTLFYQLTIENPGTGTLVGQIWSEIDLPWGGTISPYSGPRNVTYGPGYESSSLRPLRIAPGVPPDSGYVFRVAIGFYPGTTIAYDSFPFTVLEGN